MRFVSFVVAIRGLMPVKGTAGCPLLLSASLASNSAVPRAVSAGD